MMILLIVNELMSRFLYIVGLQVTESMISFPSFNYRFSTHTGAFSGLVLGTLRESGQPSCPDQNIEELASSSFVLSAHSLRTWRQILGDVEGKFLNIWCHQTATKAQFMLPAKSFAGKCFALWLGFECLWTLVEVLNGTMGRLGARLRRDDKERVPWNESRQYWQQALWLSRSWVFACFIWKGVINFVGTALRGSACFLCT